MISASQICSVGSRRFGFHALHLKRSNCFSAFSVFSSIFFDIFFLGTNAILLVPQSMLYFSVEAISASLRWARSKVALPLLEFASPLSARVFAEVCDVCPQLRRSLHGQLRCMGRHTIECTVSSLETKVGCIVPYFSRFPRYTSFVHSRIEQRDCSLSTQVFRHRAHKNHYE